MLNLIKRLTARFQKPFPAVLSDTGPLPTMADLVDAEEMETVVELYRSLGGNDRVNPDPEDESDLIDPDEPQVVLTTPTGARKVYAILGQIGYQNSEFLVCMRQADLDAHDDDEIADDELTPAFVFQIVPGVGGHDYVLYPIEPGDLHDAIYDAFIESELD